MMQSDFDDTVMARPSKDSAEQDGVTEDAQPDVEATVVRSPAPVPLVEPGPSAHGAWPAAPSRPAPGLPSVWANSVEVTVPPESVDVPLRINPETEPVVVPGVVYGFRLGDSEIVPLNAVAYVGRRPSAPRIVKGEMPRLVRVESPANEVSSTHVELRQLGATVVVTDLKSTNGTIVEVPGSPPHRLRGGESIAVTRGTLVDIGDSVILEIVPVPVRATEGPVA
jgi:hypothetical protein